MPHLRTQKDLAAARRLRFCYVCGKTFERDGAPNRDHVPSKAIFAEEDRSPPLILLTHPTCNEANSPRDEAIGQLVSAFRGQPPRPERARLSIKPLPAEVAPHSVVGLHDFPFLPIVGRWVRGFHAALYGEYLADPGGFIYSPMDEYPRNATERRLIEGNRAVRPVLTAILKEQVAAGRYDSIECYNGKCRYRCTWTNTDDGDPICVFALRLYDWEELGPMTHTGRRGCLGHYPATPPPSATRATQLAIAIPNLEPLNPFGP